MRTKMLCLSMLLAALFCQFATCVSANATNDGDWTPTSRAEWWWKYVYPVGDKHPTWMREIGVAQVLVGSDRVDPATGDLTTGAVVTFKNTTSSTITCDGSVTILHTLRAADGSVKSSQVVARTLLPAKFAPGQSFEVRSTAFTSAKLRGFTHTFEVQVR